MLLSTLVEILQTYQARQSADPGHFMRVMEGAFGHSTQSMFLVSRAHRDASDAHKNQQRDDGQAYITHPEQATIISILYLGHLCVEEAVALLLHDASEDNPEHWPISWARAEYSITIADTLSGCNRRRFDHIVGKEAQNAEFLYQLLHFGSSLSCAVKLIERLHNGLTMTPEKLGDPTWRARKVAELETYYIPMARKHGMLYREMIALVEVIKTGVRLLNPPPQAAA